MGQQPIIFMAVISRYFVSESLDIVLELLEVPPIVYEMFGCEQREKAFVSIPPDNSQILPRGIAAAVPAVAAFMASAAGIERISL